MQYQSSAQRAPKADLSQTEYSLLRALLVERLGWRQWSRKEDKREEVTLFWRDTYIGEDFVRKLLPFQRVNRFPGSQELGRKDRLAFNLAKLRTLSGLDLNFFPQTWCLPQQETQFRRSLSDKSYYIAKPANESQGRGIFLFAGSEGQLVQNLVVQRYIERPFLLEGLKFDFRLYVLLRSVHPFRLYLYKEGLVRFATTPYQQPDSANCREQTMHLTNYAINRKSPLFEFNQSLEQQHTGHKRSLSSVLARLQVQGCDTVRLMQQIHQLTVLTFMSALEQLEQAYVRCSQQRPDLCFELFGLDILLDRHFKPILLEVNHTPSFCTDTPLDLAVKSALILDTINLINLSDSHRRSYFQDRPENRRAKKAPLQEGPIGGFHKLYPSNDPLVNKVERLLKRTQRPAGPRCPIRLTVKIRSKDKSAARKQEQDFRLLRPLDIKFRQGKSAPLHKSEHKQELSSYDRKWGAYGVTAPQTLEDIELSVSTCKDEGRRSATKSGYSALRHLKDLRLLRECKMLLQQRREKSRYSVQMSDLEITGINFGFRNKKSD